MVVSEFGRETLENFNRRVLVEGIRGRALGEHRLFRGRRPALIEPGTPAAYGGLRHRLSPPGAPNPHRVSAGASRGNLRLSPLEWISQCTDC